ncbi:putative F-box domain, leucine-rich repeat domain superfamily, F-box-like domain superfamily [Helianthus debilis subsp. tardiflorus]
MEEHQSSCLTETSETGEMDRISHLPDSIVHHILSFLKTLDKVLVRMSVLSKTWFHLTASFPVLDFTIHNFTHLSRKSFFKYVDYTTSRFCHQNLIAHTFKLVTNLLEPAELDIVNGCLLLLFQNGVRKLEIDFLDYTDYTNSSFVPKYCLPNTLLSISALRSLTIYGCDLPSSLMVDTIKFKSLVYLELKRVRIDDEVINYITTSCPLLQVLQIKSCPGFKRFCVHGHQHLRRALIYYDTPVERIDIATPNLYSLSIMDINGRGAPRMNVASCKKLTTVVYYGNPLLNSNGFSDFLSNFPFIKTLFLFSEYKCNNLILSSFHNFQQSH